MITRLSVVFLYISLIFKLFAQENINNTIKVGKELNKNYYIEFEFNSIKSDSMESGGYNFKKFDRASKPEFPGGIDSLKSYLSIKLNNNNFSNNKTVRVIFDIPFNGYVCNVRLDGRSDCGMCDTQIIQVFYDMPEWQFQHLACNIMSCRLILQFNKGEVFIKDFQYFRFSSYIYFLPGSCNYVKTDYNYNPFLFIK